MVEMGTKKCCRAAGAAAAGPYPANDAPTFNRTLRRACQNAVFPWLDELDSMALMSPMAWIRAKGKQLFRIKDTPHAIAVGVAVGVFFGFLPLWGVKTLLALGVTWLLRGNVIAAAITITLHDVLLPIMPLLLRWEYDLGYWLLSHPHELPPHLHLAHHSPSQWMHWSTFLTVGRPLLVGSLVIAVPIGVITYYLTLFLVQRFHHERTAAAGS
jgi:uncharacterized protein (DUF2062 family)